MISPESSSRAAVPRPRELEGCTVGISVSLGDDSADFGFTDFEMNRAIVQLSEVLLTAGACLVFGHDWRADGIMPAIARLAVASEPSEDVNGAIRKGPCRITSLVPADRHAQLDESLREHLRARGLLNIIELATEEGFEPRSAVALERLRLRLTKECDARICIGGKLSNYMGFAPGVVEEALLSAQRENGNAVLVSGLMGGAAKALLEAGKTGAWDRLLDFQLSEDAKKELGDEKLAEQRQRYADEAPRFLGRAGLIQRSGLDADDWDRLADASDISVVAALAVKALAKLRERR